MSLDTDFTCSFDFLLYAAGFGTSVRGRNSGFLNPFSFAFLASKVYIALLESSNSVNLFIVSGERYNDLLPFLINDLLRLSRFMAAKSSRLQSYSKLIDTGSRLFFPVAIQISSLDTKMSNLSQHLLLQLHYTVSSKNG